MRTPSAILTKVALAMALVVSFAVSAEEEPTLDLPPAPSEDVKQIKEVCLELITEQEIPLEEQESYLLTCVNDQLFEMGYLAVVQQDLN
ncbi:hypothetical protein [Shewanella litorisediminis]|uniref:Orphan protein n=1 Tax=Shewanella litorisediminis TaxID=1173586 RepID=A0ABX7G144_9GAMM|nr:hypothetical protein [Shewanella litorisediminis]MCL2918983.1 hypothetical protein [Shewanella litorisediminis]QRH01050.1 hypothetical protein JQC75_14445 [Shewanella litorisediminis]